MLLLLRRVYADPRMTVASTTTATTTIAFVGAVASVIENVRDFFAAVFHYHGH